MAKKMPAAAASAEPRPKVKRDDDVDVDAHERGGLVVEGQRAHGRADLGFQHDEPQREQQHGGHDQHDDMVAVDRQSRRVGNLHAESMRETARVAAPKTWLMLAGVFEEQRNADGGDEHGQFRPAAQRTIGKPFNHNPDDRADRHRQHHDDQRRRHRIAAGRTRAIFGARKYRRTRRA